MGADTPIDAAAAAALFRYKLIAVIPNSGCEVVMDMMELFSLEALVNHTLCRIAYRHSVMHMQRGLRGQFSSLYRTTTLRLKPDFPYPPGGPRYERLVFDANDQLIAPLNEWYQVLSGVVFRDCRSTHVVDVWST